MDRFIGLRLYPFDIDKKLFKIQYGQIYSVVVRLIKQFKKNLKSNMDRFIAESNETDNYGATVFKIQYGQIYSFVIFVGCVGDQYLKSNMDRFIVYWSGMPRAWHSDLKSNMDRFIDIKLLATKKLSEFKIQYGQIYRIDLHLLQYLSP